MSAVTALQLGLIYPPDFIIQDLRSLLAQGDNTSDQYKIFCDLENLFQIGENGKDYMDALGTCGAKLVLEVINFPLLDAIFYGFATLVDGSTSRRDKEAIEGIKAAVYNCDTDGDYIKTPYGLDALVGDVVTVLNNRKTRREAKTVMGAIHEIQNRLVGKDEKSKTQAMITHNPREVLVHRSLLGECLTPEEKNMLNCLADKRFCSGPIQPSDISTAIKGQKFRKVNWQSWNDDNSADLCTISPQSFCRVNPEHMTVKDLSPDGGGDETSYNGFVYISNRLFEMASDERDDAAGITVGFSRMMKVFNTSDDWGQVCIPAHPNNTSVAFAFIDKETDHTRWKVASSMRKMKNSKHVPEKRRKLLPGIVRNMITQQENKEFTCIKDDQDFQRDIAFSHLKNSTLGKDIIKGPGDGMKMLQIMFDQWLAPEMLQQALENY